VGTALRAFATLRSLDTTTRHQKTILLDTDVELRDEGTGCRTDVCNHLGSVALAYALPRGDENE
jgi:hypothetical protein